MKKLFVFLAIAVALWSCERNMDMGVYRHEIPSLVNSGYDYENQQFPEGVNGVAQSHLSIITNEKAALGRVLFYDTKLSINNAISCGSCHKQGKAFADEGRFSSGFRGVKTTRNSPPTFNAGLNNTLFWDSRASSLHEQVLMPAFDHVEMGMKEMDDLVEKLKHVDYYNQLFAEAYPSVSTADRITEDHIRECIEDFIRSMISFNSQFDKFGQVGISEDVSGLSPIENLGGNVFFGKGRCSSCHNGTNFGTWGNANIGLEMEYEDPGIAGWNINGLGEGAFKIPSLRNLSFTAPYMHDGRFNTLEEVIEHYNSGIKPHPNLSFSLWQNASGWEEFSEDTGEEPLPITVQDSIQPVKLGLTETEKSALKAFLKTLNDFELVNDPKFSDPFMYAD